MQPTRPAPLQDARSRAGFSLIELMGVLVLLGMIAGLSYVGWQSMVPRSELNTAVRELQATLYETRSDAIARNAEFRIQYAFEDKDGHPRGFRVVTPFRAGGLPGLASNDEERMALQWHVLPDTVRFKDIFVDGQDYSSGIVEVVFRPSGAANDHYVVLQQDPYENLFTVEVLALTGQIRLHRGEFRREYPQDSDFR